jgi:Rrf2 family protein
MRVSKRFPIAVHTLLIISRFDGTDRATSNKIAQSTGANAVIIRNIFSALKKAGLINSTAGKKGGVCLARDTKDMTLWDIYRAVETDDIDEIFKFHEGSETCVVGKNIYQLMLPHIGDALNAMKAELDVVSLDTLICELGDHLAGQA